MSGERCGIVCVCVGGGGAQTEVAETDGLGESMELCVRLERAMHCGRWARDWGKGPRKVLHCVALCCLGEFRPALPCRLHAA